MYVCLPNIFFLSNTCMQTTWIWRTFFRSPIVIMVLPRLFRQSKWLCHMKQEGPTELVSFKIKYFQQHEQTTSNIHYHLFSYILLRINLLEIKFFIQCTCFLVLSLALSHRLSLPLPLPPPPPPPPPPPFSLLPLSMSLALAFSRSLSSSHSAPPSLCLSVCLCISACFPHLPSLYIKPPYLVLCGFFIQGQKVDHLHGNQSSRTCWS